MTFGRAMRQAGYLVLAVCFTIQPAQTQTPEKDTPTFRSGASEILVDVIVRDKKGKLIRGLQPGEVRVLEDGVPQPVTSFREIRGDAPASVGPRQDQKPTIEEPKAETGGNTIQVEQQARLVALVFDRLGPEGRRLSRQAALEFMKVDRGANVYYGVFYLDRSLRIVQNFTNRADLLRAAVATATGGERSDFANDALARAAQATGGSEGAAAAVSSAASAGSPGAVSGASMADEAQGRMIKEMSDFSQMVTREDLGRVSVFSLWAVIQGMSQMAGRKSILYFAEGLEMPNALWLQFQSMISAANRQNVTVYAVDARGLIVSSDQTRATSMMAEAARRSAYTRSTQVESASDMRLESKTWDIALDSIRANGQNMLAELAVSTGGFLIANTNDFRPGLEKLSEEFNSYYAITYKPTNPSYDGRFRAITVEVSRRDTVVQSRNGYFSLPPMEGQTVFPYEVPLLKALGRSPLPRDLEFRVGVLSFRKSQASQQSLLVFDLPLSQATFVKDETAAGKFRSHLSVLSLIKDERGQVVAKLSRDVPLNEPAEHVQGFKAGRFIVSRPVTLVNGRYTVESAVVDLEGEKLAAKKIALIVSPVSAGGPGLSDITLVRRLEKPPEFRDSLDPLQLPQTRVIPTLNDTVPGGERSMLSLFFVAYSEDGITAKPKLILDLLQEGKLLTRSSPELPTPDSAGAMPYLANIPLAGVKPGQYEFRAILIQGEKAVQRSRFVNVE